MEYLVNGVFIRCGIGFIGVMVFVSFWNEQSVVLEQESCREVIGGFSYNVIFGYIGICFSLGFLFSDIEGEVVL